MFGLMQQETLADKLFCPSVNSSEIEASLKDAGLYHLLEIVRVGSTSEKEAAKLELKKESWMNKFVDIQSLMNVAYRLACKN